MAKSRYQSANKELGEMYEHELVQTAEELDATINELIAESNALMSTNDALRAELARVKAESLRVVAVGGRQVASSNRIEYFTHDGYVYHWESCQYERDEVFARGLTTNRDLDLRCSKLVQPVRLERWEDD